MGEIEIMEIRKTVNWLIDRSLFSSEEQAKERALELALCSVIKETPEMPMHVEWALKNCRELFAVLSAFDRKYPGFLKDSAERKKIEFFKNGLCPEDCPNLSCRGESFCKLYRRSLSRQLARRVRCDDCVYEYGVGERDMRLWDESEAWEHADRIAAAEAAERDNAK